jgi:hypothetical protein
MMFQVIGAVLAALAVTFLKGGAAVRPLQPATAPPLLAEFLFTFALAAGAFGALNPAERVSVHQSGSTDQPRRQTEAA